MVKCTKLIAKAVWLVLSRYADATDSIAAAFPGSNTDG